MSRGDSNVPRSWGHQRGQSDAQGCLRGPMPSPGAEDMGEEHAGMLEEDAIPGSRGTSEGAGGHPGMLEGNNAVLMSKGC